ncbi:MAG TPA: FAD-dependent oxidoreductase [Thermohalobaculum sp.]|nr:FAD-dependent oxidoreductase [Thermohalobaculum sp.]
MTAMREAEYAIIGGGLVGMAIAWGLMRCGRAVSLFDEGDRAFRASRGNFGLIWVQGKGVAMPDYARWSRLSAHLWPAFRDELAETAGLDLELSQPGGMHLFLSEAEAEETVGQLGYLRAALGGDYPFEYLGHNATKAMIPEIGPDVVGGTISAMDGHVNPLYLLRALHTAFTQGGGRLENGAPVDEIEPLAEGFRIRRRDSTWQAQNVVLCAGLGNARLAPMVGLDAPVRPNRGQVLITEKVRPFLRLPTGHVRQVGEGAVQIGDSKEDAGFDDGTRSEVVARIARRATRLFPILENVRVVRSWGALRVMSPDGHPIYDRSAHCPGASVVNCHSGVTLAAVHAKVLPGWITGENALDCIPDYMEVFSAGRFRLQAAG